jgi:hypothetical protein
VRSGGEKEEVGKNFLNAKNYRRSSIIVDKADNDYQSDLIDNKLSKTSLLEGEGRDKIPAYSSYPSVY